MFRNRLAGRRPLRAMRGFYAPSRQHRALLRGLGLLLV